MLEFDTPELKKEFDRQYKLISRGTVDLLPESEFQQKLLDSIKNNIPLDQAGKKYQQSLEQYIYPECLATDIEAQCRKTYQGKLILGSDLLQITI